MSPRFLKDGKWWVVPPGMDKKHALPEGTHAVFHALDDEPPKKSHQNYMRQVAVLQRAAKAALERKPQIRTGPQLRAAMEGDAQGRRALEFSNSESVDRLLTGFVDFYKLGRAAR